MPVTHSRLVLIIAVICFVLAALTEAAGPFLGPAWAWGFGGFAAWVLSGVVTT